MANGALNAWPAPACNNPIFAEIVPARLRTFIYAFDRSFEMAVAACAAPVVGKLAESAFGFQVRWCVSACAHLRLHIRGFFTFCMH
jgi:hypothetical protein